MVVESNPTDCKIEYTGQSQCYMCVFKGMKKRTNYQCGTHKIAICILGCYDMHRNNTHL